MITHVEKTPALVETGDFDEPPAVTIVDRSEGFVVIAEVPAQSRNDLGRC
jgi:hypothetical protein